MRYRVYFNRSEDAPQVWSLDEGSHASEINVQGIQVAGNVPLASAYNPAAELPEPKAWFELEAHLAIRGGVAFLVPEEIAHMGPFPMDHSRPDVVT